MYQKSSYWPNAIHTLIPELLNTSFTHFLSSNTKCVTKWYSITLQNNSWGRGGGRYENLGVHNFYKGLLKELWGCTHPQFRRPLVVTVSLSEPEFLPWGIILLSLKAKLTCLILTILNECIIFAVLYPICSTHISIYSCCYSFDINKNTGHFCCH